MRESERLETFGCYERPQEREVPEPAELSNGELHKECVWCNGTGEDWHPDLHRWADCQECEGTGNGMVREWQAARARYRRKVEGQQAAQGLALAIARAWLDGPPRDPTRDEYQALDRLRRLPWSPKLYASPNLLIEQLTARSVQFYGRCRGRLIHKLLQAARWRRLNPWEAKMLLYDARDRRSSMQAYGRLP